MLHLKPHDQLKGAKVFFCGTFEVAPSNDPWQILLQIWPKSMAPPVTCCEVKLRFQGDQLAVGGFCKLWERPSVKWVNVIRVKSKVAQLKFWCVIIRGDPLSFYGVSFKEMKRTPRCEEETLKGAKSHQRLFEKVLPSFNPQLSHVLRWKRSTHPVFPSS